MKAPICLATVTISCRLVIRETTPGRDTMWPLLVARCPWANPWEHYHVHAICDSPPAGRWLRSAPCSRRPYMLAIEAAA